MSFQSGCRRWLLSMSDGQLSSGTYESKKSPIAAQACSSLSLDSCRCVAIQQVECRSVVSFWLKNHPDQNILSLIIIFMRADPKKQQYAVNLYTKDLINIYVKLQVEKSLIIDLKQWSRDRQFRYFLSREINYWLSSQNHKADLKETAAKSVEVIDHLISLKLPNVVIETYLQALLRHKQLIKNQLNYKTASKLFNSIPTCMIIDYMVLYEIDISQKQKQSILEELVQTYETCRAEIIIRYLRFLKNQKKYTQMAIQELIQQKAYQVAAIIMKKKSIDKAQFPIVEKKILQIAAINMPKWQREKFSWEVLEQVYSVYPHALAAAIISMTKFNKKGKSELQGFASIIKRIPEVQKFLDKKTKDKLKGVFNDVKNKLQNNKFAPSDKEIYFSLSEFGYSEQNTIWVDEKNLEYCIKSICDSKLIGIDTESRVAKTTFSNSWQSLATIQIATPKQVFVIDAMFLKEIKLKSPEMALFFTNPEVTIVGHTLQADLNGQVTTLLGFGGEIKCKAIDIFNVFKNIFPNERAGLTCISDKILGKAICKEYTLTNWLRRPILKNQLHYAALDAVVVIKIWEKMIIMEEYASAELKYFKDLKQRAEKHKKEHRIQKDQGEEPFQKQAGIEQKELEQKDNEQTLEQQELNYKEQGK